MGDTALVAAVEMADEPRVGKTGVVGISQTGPEQIQASAVVAIHSQYSEDVLLGWPSAVKETLEWLSPADRQHPGGGLALVARPGPEVAAPGETLWRLSDCLTSEASMSMRHDLWHRWDFVGRKTGVGDPLFLVAMGGRAVVRYATRLKEQLLVVVFLAVGPGLAWEVAEEVFEESVVAESGALRETALEEEEAQEVVTASASASASAKAEMVVASEESCI
ncbi:hypothetical protein VTN96DRAFT_1259 [Rasamsonia emersonii]